MFYKPKNQAVRWRFGDTLIMIPNHINFPELMTWSLFYGNRNNSFAVSKEKLH